LIEWEVVMRSKQKTVLALCCLASTAVFSTASISTIYSETTNVSTLVCQPITDTDALSGSLKYIARGLLNYSDSRTVTVSCPVITPSENDGNNYVYNFHLVAKGENPNVAGTLNCALTEVRSLNHVKKQVNTRITAIYGTTPKSLNWMGIRKLTYSGESAFTLMCHVPPKVALGNIIVERAPR
jgi:hypothetical protein